MGWSDEEPKVVKLDINYETINEFWIKYPNGLITFG